MAVDCYNGVVNVQGQGGAAIPAPIASDGSFVVSNVPVPTVLVADATGNPNCGTTLLMSGRGVATCPQNLLGAAPTTAVNATVQFVATWFAGAPTQGTVVPPTGANVPPGTIPPQPGVTPTTPTVPGAPPLPNYPAPPPSVPTVSSTPTPSSAPVAPCSLYTQCLSTQTVTLNCGR
jgi:hypothetical protein